MCSKETGLHGQNVVIILGSISNIIAEVPIGPLNKHENLQFDNKDMKTSSDKYEEGGYGLDVDMLTI